VKQCTSTAKRATYTQIEVSKRFSNTFRIAQ
jgi:hypothetical protein